MKKIKLPYINHEQVVDEIGNFIIDTVRKVNATGAIVGLSGGVDSTTVAAIAKKAFDKENNLELVGYILPSKANAPEDEKDGVSIAKRLGIRYEIQNIEPVVNAYNSTNPEAIKDIYHKGNLMSRIRGNILNTKAATERKVLLGTGNKDEDFGVGYYTLFGDGAVHCSPIGNLSKRLVKEIAVYLGFPDTANRIPTAGLQPGQTDFGDLGYGYDAVELVTEGVEQGLSLDNLITSPQVTELIEPQLKLINKFKTIEDVIKDILQKHYEIALPKSEIVHPPVAKITLSYGDKNG